jgi:hypothetical protein
MEHIINLLDRLGISSEKTVEFLDKQKTVDDLVNDIVKHQQSLIKSDVEFTSVLKKDGEVTALTEFNRLVRKNFEITVDEAEGKKLNELFEIGKEKLTNRITEKFKDSSNKTILEENNKAQAIITQKEEHIRQLLEQIPKIEESSRSREESLRIDLALERYLEKKPLSVSIDVVFEAYKKYLNQKQYIIKDTVEGLKLYNSEGGSVLNEDKSAFLSLDDVTIEYLSRKNLIKNSNAGSTGTANNHNPNTNINGVLINPIPKKSNMIGLDKIQRRLAGLKT